MLENPTVDSSATANAAPVKRYAPPNQRNRALGRRKSGGDRLERTNSYPSEGEKNASKNAALSNFGDVGSSSSNRLNENSLGRLIPLHGCAKSEAVQLLNERWAATMNALNNLPEDSPDRPFLYKSASPWGGPAMLPHLLMSPHANSSTGSKKDFLNELRNAIRNVNPNADV